MMIYWLTGQPGSGKSTLSMALKSALRARGHPVVHLDGEFLRDVMDNRDFSLAGRMRNIKAGQQRAAKLHADGIVVVASFVSPYRNLREEFKRKGDVVEIYLHTKEMRGRERYSVDEYESPLERFVDIDTTKISVPECIEKILQAAPLLPADPARQALD